MHSGSSARGRSSSDHAPLQLCQDLEKEEAEIGELRVVTQNVEIK